MDERQHTPYPNRDAYGESAAMTEQQELALNALLAWNAARQEVNRLKAERSSHRCTESCDGDYLTGDMGQAPCWQSANDGADGLCDECAARQKLAEPIAYAKRKASELRQKMQRQAGRLSVPPAGQGEK